MAVAANQNAPLYRWYVLGLLTLAQSCHIMDRMVVSILMEPIRHEFVLSDTMLALISSLGFSVVYGMAVIPMGLLVDRSVRKRALAIILALWSVLTFICGFATNWIMLLVARCLVGAAESGGSPAGLSLLSDYFSPRERSTAVGLWYMSSAIGTVVTFMVGGYAAAHYGWRYGFFLAGLPGLVLAVLVYLTVREPERGASDGKPPVRAVAAPEKLGMVASFREIGRRPAALHIIMGVLATAAAISSYSIWSVSFLVRQHHLPLSQAGIAIGFTLGIVGALGSMFFGFLADFVTKRDVHGRPWRSGMIAAVTSVVAAGLGIVSVTIGSTTLALIFVGLYAFFFTSYNGPANGLLLTVAPARTRGFAIALLQLGGTLVGFGIAPFVVGRISDLIGGPGSLGTALALILLCHVWAAFHFAMAAVHERRVGLPA